MHTHARMNTRTHACTRTHLHAHAHAQAHKQHTHAHMHAHLHCNLPLKAAPSLCSIELLKSSTISESLSRAVFNRELQYPWPKTNNRLLKISPTLDDWFSTPSKAGNEKTLPKIFVQLGQSAWAHTHLVIWRKCVYEIFWSREVPEIVKFLRKLWPHLSAHSFQRFGVEVWNGHICEKGQKFSRVDVRAYKQRYLVSFWYPGINQISCAGFSGVRHFLEKHEFSVDSSLHGISSQFFYVETKWFVNSNQNVILTRQTCSQRSSMSAGSKRRAIACYFPKRICYMFLISKCRGKSDGGMCTISVLAIKKTCLAAEFVRICQCVMAFCLQALESCTVKWRLLLLLLRKK